QQQHYQPPGYEESIASTSSTFIRTRGMPERGLMGRHGYASTSNDGSAHTNMDTNAYDLAAYSDQTHD
ncbi:hypothetical protein BX616_000537, partial [Lobosporangium transversale]